MKVLVFLNNLDLGGTERAALCWARGLSALGHQIEVLTLKDGVRRNTFEQAGFTVHVTTLAPKNIAALLKDIHPDIIHAHVPGHPHEGNVLGEALALLPNKIPVVQTNIFGKFQNPVENAWTDFRLFVSWTSCVQAARRSFQRMDAAFFRRASVAVNPLEPMDPPSPEEVATFRRQHQIADGEILLGRISRPEPNKWTDLALDSFRLAARQNSQIKLLLREPPRLVAERLRASPDANRFVILPATGDREELRLTMAALDIVLHTSSIGESFGYGIAEPMDLGRPIISHSVPWGDQAQIELVRHGECGFIASTPRAMAHQILRLAQDKALRDQMGTAARRHIRSLASPAVSASRLEKVLATILNGADNPFLHEDIKRAREAAAYLDVHQFGHSLLEQLALRPFYYRVRFNQLRKSFRAGAAA